MLRILIELSQAVQLCCFFSHNRNKNAYIEKCWEDVQVGDFVQLQCNEIIPADILLLYCSDQNGICHLETANLDGETNLKQRQVVKGYANQVGPITTSAAHLPSVILA